MKQLPLILILLLSSHLFAQNDTLIINNDYKFKIGVKGLYERNALDGYYFANFFNYGVQGFYKIGKKGGNNIEIGFYFIKRISSINLVKSDRSNTFSSIYENQKIFIPVKFNKNITLSKDYFLLLSVGSYLEYLINNNFDLPKDALPPKSLYDNKYVYGLIYNLGIERNINSKFSIVLDIGFNHNYTSLKSYENSYLDVANIARPYTYNYGVGFGVLYKIQNR